MGIATKQLEAIFQEIKEHLTDNPYITVKPDKGDPPEKYEITYNIKGLHLNKKKEVVAVSHHSIVISIPFGFPHFPPNCKPISPIYHPDFDQAAICIGDFWNKNSSIIDLIVHIGRMICGQVFSAENAFNEEAVTWYKQHRDSLPFESPDFSPIQGKPVSPPRSEPFLELETLEIDTLEELEPEVLPPDIEQSAISDVSSAQQPQDQRDSDIDTDLLKLMVKQKRFHTLNGLIQSIPVKKLPPLVEELRDKAKAELSMAKKIYQQGLDFEQQGQPDKAFEKFKGLTEKISDYPELEEALKRTQLAAEAFKDFQQLSEKKKGTNGTTAVEEKQKVTFFTEKPKIHTPVLPIIIASSAAILVIIAVFFLYSTNSQYKKAQAAYLSCKSLLSTEKFKEAESKCNLALSIVSDIHFLKGQERTSLSHDIQTTLSSQKLRQGLAGMILVNGRFIPREEQKALAAFEKEIKQGDTAAGISSWNNAQKHYQQALDISDRVESIAKGAPNKVETAQKGIAQAEANIFLNEGKKLKAAGKPKESLAKLKQARNEATKLDDSRKKSLLQIIEPLLTNAQFLQLIEEGDSALSQNNWHQAATRYAEAVDLGKMLPAVPPSELTELSAKKAKATLYATIEEGKTAFDKAQWDKAIRLYESAIALLKENSNILQKGSSEKNRKKLSRIMLQASVIRDKQEVARNLKDKKNPQAITKLQNILKTIQKSPFSQEEYFQQISKEVHLRITEVRNGQLVSEGREYLIKNYKDIVTKNYPIAKQGKLSDPEATFVKKLGSKLLFKIECTDNGQGSPLRLIMYYTYDPGAKKWEFYSNTKE